MLATSTFLPKDLVEALALALGLGFARGLALAVGACAGRPRPRSRLKDAAAAATTEAATTAYPGVAAEGEALSDDAGAFLRVATNLVKMRSAQHSHAVVVTAIETLGGNGAIESFSVLPRLLRDNVVYENWEGTHNTLVAQTLRDFGRLGLHTGFIHTLRQMGDGLDADLSDAIAPAWAGLTAFEHALPEILDTEDPGVGALLLRPHAERLGDVIFAVALARDVASEPDPERRDADLDVLRFFISEHFSSQPAPVSIQTQRLSKIASLEG